MVLVTLHVSWVSGLMMLSPPLFSKSKYTLVVLPVREGRCVPLALVGGNSEEHVEGADLRGVNSRLARCGGRTKGREQHLRSHISPG